MRHHTSVAFLALILALIMGVIAVPYAAAQADDEEEEGPLRQMTAKLAEIEKEAAKIAKVDEKDSASIDTDALMTIIDWLGARAGEFEKSDDRALARQAGKLEDAVETAQGTISKLARGDATPKQANIDLQNVVEIGEELVAILSKNN